MAELPEEPKVAKKNKEIACLKKQNGFQINRTKNLQYDLRHIYQFTFIIFLNNENN